MNQYIITEEVVELIEGQLKNESCKKCPYEGGGVNSGILSFLRSNPYNPQAERDLPHCTSTELLLVAHDEWKCRQERRHYDDEGPWTSGWISGFLISRKWANEKVEKLRQGGE